MAKQHTANPFPGMNPWLEKSWGNVHHEIISYTARTLGMSLPPGLFAVVEETVYVVAPDTDVDDASFRPDVSVHPIATINPPADRTRSVVGVAEPTRIRLLSDPVTLGHVEIRRMGGDEPLVTAIEVFSPTNKFDRRSRAQYLAKRQTFRAAGASVVEIDLLRGGRELVDVPPGAVRPEQLMPYKACVRRGGEAGDLEIEYYHFPLRQRLPKIAIPLRPQDVDAVLDLQTPIDEVYEQGRYGMRTNYNESPVPVLATSDAEWAASLLREQGVLA